MKFVLLLRSAFHALFSAVLLRLLWFLRLLQGIGQQMRPQFWYNRQQQCPQFFQKFQQLFLQFFSFAFTSLDFAIIIFPFFLTLLLSMQFQVSARINKRNSRLMYSLYEYPYRSFRQRKQA